MVGATPSLWYTLFEALDPEEAEAAAVAAPQRPPGDGGAPPPDFSDNDFQRWFVEQHCWRRTGLCSACFGHTPNAGLAVWKARGGDAASQPARSPHLPPPSTQVRLCSPCMAACVRPKTKAAKLYHLPPKAVAALPSWASGITGCDVSHRSSPACFVGLSRGRLLSLLCRCPGPSTSPS